MVKGTKSGAVDPKKKKSLSQGLTVTKALAVKSTLERLDLTRVK